MTDKSYYETIERAAQNRYGREQQRLSLPKRPEGARQERARKPPKPPRPVDAHEALLKRALDSGAEVRFWLMGDEPSDSGGYSVFGRVKDFDRFSVLVESCLNGEIEAIFKHAIVKFALRDRG